MIAERLIRAFVRRPDTPDDPTTRTEFGVLEGWVSVAINLVVFVVKLVPGLLIGSVSLVADAFHSLGDVVGSSIVIFGFKAAAKPSDREHPFGHGRIESIAALVMSLLLFLAAWEFGKASVAHLANPHPVQASYGLLALLGVTLVLKEWLSRFSLDLGRRIGSSALIADFWHHRSDVLATGVVMLALLAGRFGHGWIDGVAGLVVSGFIAWSAWEPLRGAIDPLIGQAPSPQVLEEMRQAALSVDGVDAVHDLVVHRYGELAVSSLHIEVDARLDIVRGHELAEAVERRLNERLAGWSIVHVDPVNRDHPLYSPVERFLAETLPSLPGHLEFHDLRIAGSNESAYVIFDLQAADDPPPEVVARLESAVRMQFPAVSKVVVNVEPRYVY